MRNLKKILISILSLFIFFTYSSSYANNYVSNNINNTEKLSVGIQMRLDTILSRFFNKLDNKIHNKDYEIKILKKIITKIENLKKIKDFSYKKILILDYIELKIKTRISKITSLINKVCIMEYVPVCAIIKQSTIRCIKAPCPNNSIYKTFSNSCMAQKSGYKIAYLGECRKNEIVGGDKDKHGCIGSAGYSWCAVKNKCIRPWEEKCKNTIKGDNTLISPEKYQDILGLGIDVNWVNFPKEVNIYINKWPQTFKAKGFDNVRIRFSKDVDIVHLKKVVDDSLKAGLIPIVAFGASDFKNNPDIEDLQKAVEIWKKVAESLKDESYKVSFDLIIEPGKSLKLHDDILFKYYETIVPMIRNVGGNNKNRIIFLAPNHLANPEYLQDLTSIFQKLNDKYLMAEFHFLAAGPFRKTNSTQKRITWNGNGSVEERQKIENRLKIAYDWQNKNNIKVWFGAWMPGNYNHTNDGGDNNYSIEEQVSFSKYFEGLLKKYKIPNDINADQKFYDIEKNTWRTDRLKVVDSIINEWKK